MSNRCFPIRPKKRSRSLEGDSSHSSSSHSASSRCQSFCSSNHNADEEYYSDELEEDGDSGRGGSNDAATTTTAAQEKQTSHDVSMLSAFVTFDRISTKQHHSSSFRLTPFMVYQILRGHSFPQKVLILVQKKGSEGEERKDSAPIEKALVQFLSHAELLRVEQQLDNVIVQLAVGGGGSGSSIEAAYRMRVRRCREPKVFAFHNTETSLIVVPQCVHLMGPIFDRSWSTETTPTQPPTMRSMTAATAGHSTAGTNASSSRNAIVVPTTATVGVHVPLLPRFVADATASSTLAETHVKRYVPPAGVATTTPTAVHTPQLQQQYHHQLPPCWVAMKHPVYDADFYVFTDPVTGERRSSWVPPPTALAD